MTTHEKRPLPLLSNGAAWRRLRQDRSGSVAMIFGVALVPLVLAAGIGIDYSRAASARAALQNVADGAALAGADAKGDSAAKQQAATTYYASNVAKVAARLLSQTPSVTVAGDMVTVTANAQIATTLMALVMPRMDLSVSSRAAAGSASVLSGAPLCILALDPTAPASFHLQGTADLNAPTCAVHVNSTNSIAIDETGSPTGVAYSFCAVGGADTSAGSNWTPMPIKNCPVVPDPYADGRYSPTTLGLEPPGACTFTNLKPANGATLSPGVYCGVTLIGANRDVRMAAGTYRFYGDLDIRAGARLRGGSSSPTMTLYFLDGAALTVQAGADLEIDAPTSGPLAGMAIVSAPANVAPTGQLLNGHADVVHTIIGGGYIKIVGTMYVPGQTVYITGNGDINQDSPLFAIIANKVNIQGNGVLNVKGGTDHVRAGLPALPCQGPCGGTATTVRLFQ